jgi:hypothetical protein
MPHFFLGIGPLLSVDLTGDHKATTFGAGFTIGGYLATERSTREPRG